MAFLYVMELESLTIPQEGGAAQMAHVPAIAEQTLVITNVAPGVSSVGFNAKTRFVRLQTDAVCSVAWGTAPVPTVTSMRMAANQTEYFGVTPGYKVAVLVNT